MRPEPLPALRHALLTALGLGACTAATPPGAAGEPEPPPVPAAKGYVKDADGTVHRAGPTECDPQYARPACTEPNPNYNECKTADDCKAGANPQCHQSAGQIGPFCACDYSCRADDDCKPGEVCVCGDAFNDGSHSLCVRADCTRDADCPSGTCAVSVYNNGCGPERVLACRTPADSCKSDTDCKPNTRCVFDQQAGRWDCLGLTCVIGRPLTIDGAARTAPAVPRADWLADLDIPHDVPADVAAALAEHWAEVARLEHASVASFARFTLELMALGAPPDLLSEAQRAALDEIDHARVAWSLASLWARRDLGPGPLALDGLPTASDLSDIVTALVKEGCVGESIGAAEAQTLADVADHPTLAALLATIAVDEARHATLAWRTLRWLIVAHGDPVRVAALTALAEARAELDAAPEPDDHGPSAPEWGLLPRRALLGLRREALAAVVEPVMAAMFGPTGLA